MITADQAEAAIKTHGGARAAARAMGVPYSTLWTAKRRRVEQLKRQETVLFLPDRHEPYTNKRALEAIYNYVQKRFSVTHLILGGDYADLFELSRFPSTPQMHPDEEIEAVIRCLEDDAKAWPCKRSFILGNHEKRLQKYVQTSAPKLARIFGDHIPKIFELERLGYDFIDNEALWESTGRFFRIGKMHYIHGHELPCGSRKHIANSVAERYRVNIALGHWHTSQPSKPYKDLEGKTIRAHCVGCGCSVLPRYAPGADHVHGFMVVVYDEEGNGHFTAYNHILDENYKVR